MSEDLGVWALEEPFNCWCDLSIWYTFKPESGDFFRLKVVPFVGPPQELPLQARQFLYLEGSGLDVRCRETINSHFLWCFQQLFQHILFFFNTPSSKFIKVHQTSGQRFRQTIKRTGSLKKQTMWCFWRLETWCEGWRLLEAVSQQRNRGA